MAALRTGVALLACWALCAASAQGIAFTVQAIAVSEQDTALELSRALLREGFPAYVVRSTGGQGDVYRVRVGAFANRAAAVRYAAAMPDVGGARPVPALAEVIPDGVMPWAPRLLWQGAVDGVDLHVAPWPADGLALRVQASGGTAQATYHLVQAGEVRTVDAWRALPLAVRPAPRAAPVLDVPFVDLTQPAATTPDGGGAEGGDGAADVAPAEDAAQPGAAASDPAAEGAAGEEATDATAGDAAAAGEVPATGAGPVLADPDGPAEEALWLLRERPLWPATWREDDDEVRAAFAAATVQLAASGAGLAVDAVAAAAYRPRADDAPSLVVVEVTDRSGRDAGDVRGVGDPAAGLYPSGPEPLAGVDAAWWPPADLGERVRVDGLVGTPVASEAGALVADGAFLRLEPEGGGAAWRAMPGAALWSDGRYVLVRDGADLVLFDLVPR